MNEEQTTRVVMTDETKRKTRREFEQLLRANNYPKRLIRKLSALFPAPQAEEEEEAREGACRARRARKADEGHCELSAFRLESACS